MQWERQKCNFLEKKKYFPPYKSKHFAYRVCDNQIYELGIYVHLNQVSNLQSTDRYNQGIFVIQHCIGLYLGGVGRLNFSGTPH